MTHKVMIMTFKVTNSAPNTDVSLVDSFVKKQLSDMFIQIMNTVLDLLVHLKLSCLLSTNICRYTSFPLSSGALGGITSTEPS